MRGLPGNRPDGGFPSYVRGWDRMKSPLNKSPGHSVPAKEGNPAYPTLEERNKIVAHNQKNPEPVKKIPADLINDPAGSTHEKPRA
jgi:hypothetical protein